MVHPHPKIADQPQLGHPVHERTVNRRVTIGYQRLIGWQIGALLREPYVNGIRCIQLLHDVVG